MLPLIVASKAQYAPLANLLKNNGAQSTLDERRWFAKEAFAVSSSYDSSIFSYFDNETPSALRIAAFAASTLYAACAKS